MKWIQKQSSRSATFYSRWHLQIYSELNLSLMDEEVPVNRIALVLWVIGLLSLSLPAVAKPSLTSQQKQCLDLGK